MPRPVLYGKISRPLGGSQPLTFSSPEQPRWKTADQDAHGPSSSGRDASRPCNYRRSSDATKSRLRGVLEEKNANAACNTQVEDPAKDEIKKKKKKKKQHQQHQQHQQPQQSSGVEREQTSNRHSEEAEHGGRPTCRSEISGCSALATREDSHDANDRQETQNTSLSSRTSPRKSRRIPEALWPLGREWSTQIKYAEECKQAVETEPGIYERHCSSLLSLSLHPESAFEPFHSWSSELSAHFDVSKIAEASFGEVYRLSLTDDVLGFGRADESVFKVIALKSPLDAYPRAKRARNNLIRREENMSHPEDVANEVRLLQRMSCIPGFTNFRDVRVLQGPPAGLFIHAFREFDRNQRARGKEGSHFPDPGLNGTYGDAQLWAVIEMQDAGTDLERLVEAGLCKSIWRIWDIFWSVVLALAKGEQGAAFEHRDLHFGNICVHMQPASSPEPDFLHADVDVRKKLAFTCLETTIIDYTISRATLSPAPAPLNGTVPSCKASAEQSVAYHDLNLDPAIFEGDSTDEYQYDIYRYMRGILFADDAYFDFQTSQCDATRSWSQYHPRTNLVWLHFILYKLLSQISWPSKAHAPKKRTKKKRKESKMEDLEVWSARWLRGNELELILLRIQELLDPGQICANGVRSSGDLVALALSEAWLDVEDVLGQLSSEDGEEDEGLTQNMDALTIENPHTPGKSTPR